MDKIEELIRKYNSGQCSAEEMIMLEQWYQSFEWNNKADTYTERNIENLKNQFWTSLQSIQSLQSPARVEIITPGLSTLSKTRTLWRYGVAAVTITAIAGIGYYSFKPSKKIRNANSITVAHQNAGKDILPGTNKALLVLGDGSVVSLDSARTMHLKESDGTNIDKISGKLVYNAVAGNGQILFNTLSTPRGGEYQLVLPDGSKVWLNAASSIKFPTRFTGTERSVYLQGEAYFEVTKNIDMPFRVIMDNNMTVQVLGTHFNIMAYGDESELITTLAQGIVKVVSPAKTVLLSPSKQAVMKRGDQTLTVSNGDVAKALAWKNGMIEFDGNDLPYIMRQLSRWYDMDINFTGAIPKGTYKGAIRRQSPLSKVLEILRIAGVQFKIDGKKLNVTGG